MQWWVTRGSEAVHITRARATLTHPTRWNSELFDHFIRKRIDLLRDRHVESPRGLAVDGQLRRSLLDRQLARLRPLEDSVHERGGTAVELGEILAIGHQPAGLHEFALREDRWKPMLEGEPGKLVPLVQKIGIIDHDQGFDTLAVELRECLGKAVWIVRISRHESYAGLLGEVSGVGKHAGVVRDRRIEQETETREVRHNGLHQLELLREGGFLGASHTGHVAARAREAGD